MLSSSPHDAKALPFGFDSLPVQLVLREGRSDLTSRDRLYANKPANLRPLRHTELARFTISCFLPGWVRFKEC